MTENLVFGPIGLVERDSFDRFGDDLTELCLSYLPIMVKFKLRLVCRTWRRLILVKQRNIEVTTRTFGDLYCYNSVIVGTDIPVSISIFTGKLLINAKAFINLLMLCPNLKAIHFKLMPKDPCLSYEILQAILHHCKFIRKLSFAYVGEVSINEMTRFLNEISTRYKNFCFLFYNVGDCRFRHFISFANYLTFRTRHSISPPFPTLLNLKTIDVSKEFHCFSKEVVTYCFNSPNLKNLHLGHIYNSISASFHKALPNIEYLTFSSSQSFFDFDFIRRTFPNLKFLNVQFHFILFGNSALLNIELPPTIESLEITLVNCRPYFNDKNLFRLISTHPKLKQTHLRMMPPISRKFFELLSQWADENPRINYVFSCHGRRHFFQIENMIFPSNLEIYLTY